MNIAHSIVGFTLLLTLSIVPHLPTAEHDALGYGPCAGDVRIVSAGVLVCEVSGDVIPVEWNAGEQSVWMGEEEWEKVPADVIEMLSGEVAARVEEVL